MRELKFRAFDKKANVMSPVDFTLERLWSENGALTYKDFEIMQYTGLHDKNGVQIYEGDIVRCKIGKGIIPVWAVVWNDNGAEWSKGYQKLSSYQKTTEVIGNIYENPELLK